MAARAQKRLEDEKERARWRAEHHIAYGASALLDFAAIRPVRLTTSRRLAPKSVAGLSLARIGRLPGPGMAYLAIMVQTVLMTSSDLTACLYCCFRAMQQSYR